MTSSCSKSFRIPHSSQNTGQALPWTGLVPDGFSNLLFSYALHSTLIFFFFHFPLSLCLSTSPHLPCSCSPPASPCQTPNRPCAHLHVISPLPVIVLLPVEIINLPKPPGAVSLFSKPSGNTSTSLCSSGAKSKGPLLVVNFKGPGTW